MGIVDKVYYTIMHCHVQMYCVTLNSTLTHILTPGGTNKEFNFRHDWNSLISDDETLQMRHYSRKYFPHADDYVCETAILS